MSNLWSKRENELDLNGPTISTSTNPSNATIWPFGDTAEENKGWQSFSANASSSFPTGLATAYATDTGTITYEWWKESSATGSVVQTKLGPSTTYTGESSSTFQLRYADSPGDNGDQYYCKLDYLHSAYGTTDPITAGTARSTGNSINGPIYSDKATVTVLPEMSVLTGPASATTIVNEWASFAVVGGLTDTSQGAISYQWEMNGNPLSDGNTNIITPATNFEHNYTNTGNYTLSIPDDAENVVIEVAAGGGGIGGSDANGGGGAAGGGRQGEFTIANGARTLTMYIQGRGGNGNSHGGGKGGSEVHMMGGDGGHGGSSGGGGGGAGGVYIHDSVSNKFIIAAGGGGGGGG